MPVARSDLTPFRVRDHSSWRARKCHSQNRTSGWGEHLPLYFATQGSHCGACVNDRCRPDQVLQVPSWGLQWRDEDLRESLPTRSGRRAVAALAPLGVLPIPARVSSASPGPRRKCVFFRAHLLHRLRAGCIEKPTSRRPKARSHHFKTGSFSTCHISLMSTTG